jgi:photosystem II stability/assembly factor-like uncharacterized protein
MELQPHWKLRWTFLVALALPTFLLFAWSAIHPAKSLKGKAYAASILPAGPHSPAVQPATSAPAPATWNMQDSGTTASLRGIFSVDGKVAWASGTEGTVLRTTDGGAHWTKCVTPLDAAKLDFRGVQAFDANQAMVMSSGPGDLSRVYKTADGGKTWTLLFKNPDIPDGFFDGFFADWNEETGSPQWTGSLLGDPTHGQFTLFDTADSGATWTRRKSPGLTADAATMGAFAASNSLFPATQENIHKPSTFISGGKAGAFFWKEKLPEHEWRRIEVPIAHGLDAAGIFSIASHSDKAPFRNVIATRETLVAVGGDYTKPGESAGTAAWSTDSGATWHAASTPPHGYRSSVAYSATADVWIAAGTNGSDVSRDEGKTWQPLDDGNWNALSPPFVVGPKGRIARFTWK